MQVYTLALAVFGIIGVVMITGMNIARQAARRRQLHQERMSAIEKGVPLPEDVESEDERDKVAPIGRDAPLQGTILTALGLGMFAAGRLVHPAELGPDAQRFLAYLEVCSYPIAFVGIGLLIYALLTRRRH